MDTLGFLMMAHMTDPEGLLGQARPMEGYEVNCISCADSGGDMLPGRLLAGLPGMIKRCFDRPGRVSAQVAL